VLLRKYSTRWAHTELIGRRWFRFSTRGWDVFASDMLIFPINVRNRHWTLVVFHRATMLLTYEDSLRGNGMVFMVRSFRRRPASATKKTPSNKCALVVQLRVRDLLVAASQKRQAWSDGDWFYCRTRQPPPVALGCAPKAWEEGDFTMSVNANCPWQGDLTSCGVCACMNAYALVRSFTRPNRCTLCR
jgi:hypothetical protein